MKTICVLGLGYIGLPTASMFATHGQRVIGVDVNNRVVEVLNQGEIHIQEPGLQTLLQAGLKSGNLIISQEPRVADAFIIAVPTPITPDKRADLKYVRAAAEAIVPFLRPGNLVILESTVPPGTTRNVLAPILSQSGIDPEVDLQVVHSPERVLPGRILVELVGNARVIGGMTRQAAEAARDLYATFVEGHIYLMDATAAEMVKLMENTYRDVNIAVANEFALIAESLGVNVWKAIEMANLHPRVNILNPGPGVGGHCIAVDPWFLVEAAPGSSDLIASARRMNDRMPQYVAEKVMTLLASTKKPKVAVLGLAYKADVDDVRESPAISVISWLQSAGYEVRAYDPYVQECGSIDVCDSLETAVANVDCLVILTDHSAWKSLDPNQIVSLVKHPLILDTRNGIDHENWATAGFNVLLLGDGFNFNGERKDINDQSRQNAKGVA